MNLYLDANAHIPMNAKALRAFAEFNTSKAGHGHAMSPAAPGRAAANAIEGARVNIAALLGASDASQIVFTGTCTSACEWGLKALRRASRRNNPIIFISPTEHSAVKQAFSGIWSDVKDDMKAKIPINSDGLITRTDFNNDIVICIHTQNETGVIQPVEEINCGLLFSDMSQTPGKIHLNLSSLSVDVAVFGAHKFGGPPSVGILYLKDIDNWVEYGYGSRYFMDRTGTPDAASIVSTAVALEDSLETLNERIEKMKEFQTTLEDGLENMKIKIIGKKSPRLPNTTFIKIPHGRAMQILLSLGEAGIHVGLGSACGSMHTGPSPLMQAMGFDGGAHDFMRISTFGEYASKEAKLFLDKFRKCIN